MKLFALSLFALVFASCALEEEPPIYAAFLDPNFKLPKQSQTPNQTTRGPASDKPSITGNRTINPSSGLRAPSDMLNLPQDDQLKSSPSTAPKDGNATLIARPPGQ